MSDRVHRAVPVRAGAADRARVQPGDRRVDGQRPGRRLPQRPRERRHDRRCSRTKLEALPAVGERRRTRTRPRRARGAQELFANQPDLHREHRLRRQPVPRLVPRERSPTRRSSTRSRRRWRASPTRPGSRSCAPAGRRERRGLPRRCSTGSSAITTRAVVRDPVDRRSIMLASRGRAGREHAADGDVRPTQGDRHHASRGRDELAHPRAVPDRRAGRGLARRRARRSFALFLVKVFFIDQLRGKIVCFPLVQNTTCWRSLPWILDRRDLRRGRRRHRSACAASSTCSLRPWRTPSTARRQDGRHQPQGAARLRRMVEILECGIALTGTEVKSLRRAALRSPRLRAPARRRALARGDAHPAVRARGQANARADAAAEAPAAPARRSGQLSTRDDEKGLSLVPLRVYFTHGIAKVEIAAGEGQAAAREAPVDREA